MLILSKQNEVHIKRVKQDDILQPLWEGVIFDMITGNLPFADTGVTGVRLVQKCNQKTGGFSLFRVEFWLSDGNENSENN